MIQTYSSSFLAILFTLRLHRSNYFYSSSEEDIELTIVCVKVIEACTQHVNTAWRPCKNLDNELAGGCIGVLSCW